MGEEMCGLETFWMQRLPKAFKSWANVNRNRLAVLISAFYSTALEAVFSLNKSADSAQFDSFQCQIVKLV